MKRFLVFNQNPPLNIALPSLEANAFYPMKNYLLFHSRQKLAVVGTTFSVTQEQLIMFVMKLFHKSSTYSLVFSGLVFLLLLDTDSFSPDLKILFIFLGLRCQDKDLHTKNLFHHHKF
jgi:hypothetical protein